MHHTVRWAPYMSHCSFDLSRPVGRGSTLEQTGATVNGISVACEGAHVARPAVQFVRREPVVPAQTKPSLRGEKQTRPCTRAIAAIVSSSASS